MLKGLDIDAMPGVYLNGTTVKGTTYFPEACCQALQLQARAVRCSAT